MINWMYHGILGNQARETQVGWTRGGFSAAILGGVNALLIVCPIDDTTKSALIAALNPTVVFLSFMGFAILDKWMGNEGLK